MENLTAKVAELEQQLKDARLAQQMTDPDKTSMAQAIIEMMRGDSRRRHQDSTEQKMTATQKKRVKVKNGLALTLAEGKAVLDEMKKQREEKAKKPASQKRNAPGSAAATQPARKKAKPAPAASSAAPVRHPPPNSVSSDISSVVPMDVAAANSASAVTVAQVSSAEVPKSLPVKRKRAEDNEAAGDGKAEVSVEPPAKQPKLFCLCQKPEDKEFYVNCGNSFCQYGEWFHPACLKMSDKDAKKLTTNWLCAGCEEVLKRHTVMHV